MGLASSGPISISIGGINPISIGSGKTRKREEEGFKVMPSKVVLDDEEEDMVGTDSVLLSRSKPYFHRELARD
jgi:N-methylhydantoinase B/oxoprolinase/acetone carboxylase alpha subunit